MGLVNLYRFLRDAGHGAKADFIDLEAMQEDPAALISRHGLDGTNAMCVQAVDMFVSLYGNEAGNLALKVMRLAASSSEVGSLREFSKSFVI